MLKKFVELYFLKKNLRLSADELQTLRNEKVKKVINHAYHHVPYYKSLFDGHGISPHDINSTDDVKHIPISTKEDLLEAGIERLVADNVNNQHLHIDRTSGSSGKPFQIKLTDSEMNTRKLMEPRAFLEMGVSLFDKRVVLGPKRDSKKDYFFHVIDKYLPVEKVIAELEKLNPSILYVYPKMLNTMLNYTGGSISDICKPRIMVTARERMEETLLAQLKQQYDFEHFNIYGSCECGILGWECKSHRGLHVNEDQVLLEIEPQSENDETSVGEVIVTTLNNYAMPFIRYRQGDFASPVSGKCECGCNFSMISAVQGRASDLLYLPSGRVVPAYYCSHVIRDIVDIFNNVQQFVTIQESKNSLVIKLVAVNELDDSCLSLLKTRLIDIFEENIDITVKLVDQIDSDETKTRDFISYVH